MNVSELVTRKLAALDKELATPLPTGVEALELRFKKSDLRRKLMAAKAKMKAHGLAASKWV